MVGCIDHIYEVRSGADRTIRVATREEAERICNVLNLERDLNNSIYSFRIHADEASVKEGHLLEMDISTCEMVSDRRCAQIEWPNGEWKNRTEVFSHYNIDTYIYPIPRAVFVQNENGEWRKREYNDGSGMMRFFKLVLTSIHETRELALEEAMKERVREIQRLEAMPPLECRICKADYIKDLDCGMTMGREFRVFGGNGVENMFFCSLNCQRTYDKQYRESLGR